MDKHYSIFNLAIMPIQGNLQGAKQKCGRDRLDQFLLCLDSHYKAIDKEEDTLLLIRAKNRNNLSFTRRFLEFAGMEKQATGIYCSVSPEERIVNYCKKMYGIEKELVTDLLTFARKSDNDYLGYIELAKEFWKMREKLYKNICTGDNLCL